MKVKAGDRVPAERKVTQPPDPLKDRKSCPKSKKRVALSRPGPLAPSGRQGTARDLARCDAPLRLLSPDRAVQGANRRKEPRANRPKVPGTGLEPAHLSIPEPKSGASTNSAIPACGENLPGSPGGARTQSRARGENFLTSAEEAVLERGGIPGGRRIFP